MAVVRKSDGAGLDSRQGGTARDTTDCQRIGSCMRTPANWCVFRSVEKLSGLALKKSLLTMQRVVKKA